MTKLTGNDSWVRELAYTARWVVAEECLDKGFLSAVFPTKDDTFNAALDLARVIAGKSPVAIMSIKKVLNYSRDHTVRESLNFTRTWNNMAL
jgi:delta(3,5)-delta(2,4)-dienoyl-CoA isomerase